MGEAQCRGPLLGPSILNGWQHLVKWTSAPTPVVQSDKCFLSYSFICKEFLRTENHCIDQASDPVKRPLTELIHNPIQTQWEQVAASRKRKTAAALTSVVQSNKW